MTPKAVKISERWIKKNSIWENSIDGVCMKCNSRDDTMDGLCPNCLVDFCIGGAVKESRQDERSKSERQIAALKTDRKIIDNIIRKFDLTTDDWFDKVILCGLEKARQDERSKSERQIAALKTENKKMKAQLEQSHDWIYDLRVERATIRSKVEGLKEGWSAYHALDHHDVWGQSGDTVCDNAQEITLDKVLKIIDGGEVLVSKTDKDMSSSGVKEDILSETPKPEDMIFCAGCAIHIPFKRYKRHCEIHQKEMSKLRKELKI